ncbi:pre-rRNA processing protein Esf1, putative [Cordyceps militaris CM01]|uniref:Pre-rRNA processing protein Esf1, putative n=1 Tax=Cordyceps militaris (strain CM01) TaxID=983644 RepID=G3JU40_CORMM|nr:pre-rRNA processing protein Esf1, putative [Cordyceps militaris CM01]EGX88194.1 pre-rRNA processing protein Esf1, putative [Cordyceps militaris CM01]
MKSDKKKGAPAPPRIADARFSNFETDPRFRLPSKKHSKTKLDKRFAGMLDDEEFIATSTVDRYGRKVKSDSKKKALQRLYEAEGDEAEKDEVEKGEVEKDEAEGEAEIEVDDDDVVQRELRAVHERDERANYDPARGGGFSSSEDEDSSEEEDSDNEEGGAELATEGDMQRLQDEQGDVETGEVSKRIAIVNLDWDHVNSTDLFALFNSFIGDSPGRVVKVSVYPSEFGKERMQREEVEGPPKELFKEDKANSDSDEEEDSDEEDERIKNKLIQEGNDQDFDSDALRKYQLDRLRYYYAVMECSDEQIAQKIYEATDGTEYQSSSNFLDLRFVPDEVDFDDEPRDECTKLSDTYKPVEFVTTALQSSKVKLTWDLNPEEASRKDSINRAFTGSRADLEENDLRAYLASDTDGSDDDDGNMVATFGGEEDEEREDVQDDAVDEDKPKLSKKELARQKMRAALGLGAEPAAKPAKGRPVGEMQITFTPALSEADAKKPAVGEEETTIEKYQRKERERKERKREAARARRTAANGETPQEAAASSEDEDAGMTMTYDGDNADGDDLGFDDPFFTSEAPAEASKSSVRKAERLKKREARLAADATNAAERAALREVMAADKNDTGTADHLDHFDMKEILRAEKLQRKQDAAKGSKSKKRAAAAAEKKKSSDGAALQKDFEMDVGDKRFQAVFDSHEYAIDPSNPKFTGSKGMQKLLEEGRRRKRGLVEGSAGQEATRKSKKAKSKP